MPRCCSPIRRSPANGLLCCLTLLLVLAAAAAAQPAGVLLPQEELVYNVRYGFIDLGQVRIRTYATEQVNDSPAYRAKAYIDSYSGVPFVDLHATFESWIDPGMFSRKFIGKSKDGKTWDYARYYFEYPEHRVLIESGKRDTVIDTRDTLGIEGHVQDGLSLFFYARDRLRSGRKDVIPCVVTEKKVTTSIDFSNDRTTAEVDAVDYPIDVIAFEGTADFVGIFGLTGDFEGWFSNDDARVPIMAKMKVILGSITIELMEWKREGWTPPRGGE
jgi:hypothetical protein